jgi:hypothetical protein
VSAALVIEEGNHYDNRLFSSFPFIGKSEFKKSVQFTESCAYTLPDYNSQDVNKLFGASFGFFAIHKHSARFGWRSSRSEGKIELLAYVYDKGVRNWDAQLRFPLVASVAIGETVECSIKVTATSYIFSVKNGDETIGQLVAVPHSKIPSWGLTASLYFGGALPAPQTIYVFMN